MSTVVLLDELAADRAEEGVPAARLKEWAAVGRRELRRAGLLRGAAQLGTVIWAGGLSWGAERGLSALHGTPVSAVLPPALLIAAGVALRAVLLAAGDAAAARGARTVRESLRGRLIETALPARGPARTDLDDVALVQAVDGEVGQLTDWLTDYLPARTTMLLGSGLTLAAIASRSWFVALLVLAATPLLPANLKVIGLGTQTAVRAQLTAIRTHQARLLDHLRGLPTLVGLGAHDQAAGSLSRHDREVAGRTEKVLRIAFLSTAWVELLITGTLAVVATYCGLVLLDYLDLPVVPDHMSLSAALFVLVLVPAYFAPARDLAAGYHARARATAAAGLLAQVLDAYREAVVPHARPAAAPPGVRLEAVTVHHPGREAPALERVSVHLAPGRCLAVTGASGAGKSTLLAVAAGLYTPHGGRPLHLLDGRPVPADPSRVAWVGQPAHLLPGTLRENLLLARPAANDHDLLDAVASLGFEDLLAALPQGLDTPLGERGTGLSSGQSQQLALIRALLRDAPLLCLDEPTAHLDPEAEQHVLSALRTLTRDRTVLLATHSPALLPLADHVITLDHGRAL
ncbi:ATP-binding cassette domain-containing protein [Streptomyces sp. NBC_01340]|uniref:ABC transporter ATP-binding protein/permease n=1 Tax=unclassified Streptomyces TaxID=2593676 RepID=UPI00225533C0|nr:MULTISPECIES: ATP-binding cassette domain-containing protein [unclassified Streptomyces]MCX4459423.1 ATP-binding cassette domain-containing protein [Streptomyces sp. NBC_01719]MCX4498780.1 ATP-binding cassette domain-containing protein [Streptomyces sp. NBC_01728]MCX4595315.1 ATP-binding cassette domain-containing protein [Streptomyces sp. NBC_01549]WSI43246.1 ATP-binding cassette domain-containing protein [Streptomyces sp. NBC_01340]